ncbi:hypothetical protein WOLCODRAFT_144962 [Wolfiporia cocos MD-104 SS10]|uniref:SET domain-containing protein n=1 Tax=Wolfiporia cocos (strain MD-104) TaxID=742152 RepID=A0A2H3JQI0_WOLCO|nr:hypothetical protein WOLCODRAFT_144962 [Wolfiporia cocos MD-104 SS10]
MCTAPDEAGAATTTLPDPDYPLRVEVHAHTGRAYHATRDLSASCAVLEASTPYACTIWKQFRNETSWLDREGAETLELLRALESARRKKVEGKVKETQIAAADQTMTPEVIERAWDEVRRKERSPKEVRKWAGLQLDNFEADMARYVVTALAHLRRERSVETQTRTRTQDQSDSISEVAYTGDSAQNRKGNTVQYGGADWAAFASLQSNELQHIRTYPELLENQIRIYQVLKGRFSKNHAASQRSTRASNTVREARDTRGGGVEGQHQERTSQIRENADDGVRDLGSVVTIENVRTALSVDPGNSFGIWEVPLTEESECLGFAVYPRPSFFNHHCSPNVKKVRRGRALRFVTTEAIRAGEELCISYGHAEEMSVRERQKELREGWFFECRCSRCRKDMEIEEEANAELVRLAAKVMKMCNH